MNKKTYLIGLIVIFLLIGQSYSYAESRAKIQLGADLLISKYHHLIDGKRVGVVTNQTGVNSQGVHIVDALSAYPNASLTAIFVPEHGLDGKAKAGAYVESYTHPTLSIPVFSLYGKTRKPTKEMMETVDVLIYDIQDIGARTYTYISTLNYCMIAAREHGKSIIVLDRPNPLGGEIVDGPVLQEGYETFVGVDRLPMAHGMTIGELALFFNRKIDADLTIAPMEGYRRDMLFEDTGLTWIPSSPNIPDLNSVKGYMATGLGEGTGIVQRDRFNWIGGKGLNSVEYAQRLNALTLPGVAFIPEQKADYGGARLQIINRNIFNPAKTGIYALATANQMGAFNIPKSGEELVMFDKIMGTNMIGDALREKLSPQAIEKKYEADLRSFKEEREKYLIYGSDGATSAPLISKATIAGGLAIDGKHYAPIRPIVEAVGASLQWEAATKIVTINMNERTIPLQPGIDPLVDDVFIKDGATLAKADWIQNVFPEINVRHESNRMIVTAPFVELTIIAAPYTPTPERIQKNEKIAYLTFDDGPSYLTSQVLDILKEYEIPATFFLLGENVGKYEAIVQRMFDEGHSIGGHTHTHDYSRIYRSPDAFFADLEKGYEAIESVIGVKPTFFRFPGGSNNQVSKSAQDPALYSAREWIMQDLVMLANERGERFFDWNVTNGDASGNSYTAQSALEKVKQGTRGRNHVVILSHDSASKAETVKALPQIIEHLKSEGYAFQTLDQHAPVFSFLK